MRIIESPFYDPNQQQPDDSSSLNLSELSAAPYEIHTNNEPHCEQDNLGDQNIISNNEIASRSSLRNVHAHFKPYIDPYRQQNVPNRIRATDRSQSPGKQALFSQLRKLLLLSVEFLFANESDRAYFTNTVYHRSAAIWYLKLSLRSRVLHTNSKTVSIIQICEHFTLFIINTSDH